MAEHGASTEDFRDWRGNPVRVGSRVVYPVRRSSRVWMVEGEVLEVLPHGPEEFRMQIAQRQPGWGAMHYQPWKRFNLLVRRLRSSRGTVRQPGRAVHLTMTLGVTVVDLPGEPSVAGASLVPDVLVPGPPTGHHPD